MGKIFKKGSISVIVLLYTLSFSANANAGFFDWLVSTEDQSNLLISGTKDNSISSEGVSNVKTGFEKIQIQSEPIAEFEVVKTYTVRATGYSSTPDQTDDTPFVTASGKYVHDGIIAANFYIEGRRVPFGTLIRIPEVYGDKIFVVEDRMNIRYTNNIDVWFPERNLAKSFGSQKVIIEIVAAV